MSLFLSKQIVSFIVSNSFSYFSNTVKRQSFFGFVLSLELWSHARGGFWTICCISKVVSVKKPFPSINSVILSFMKVRIFLGFVLILFFSLFFFQFMFQIITLPDLVYVLCWTKDAKLSNILGWTFLFCRVCDSFINTLTYLV